MPKITKPKSIMYKRAQFSDNTYQLQDVLQALVGGLGSLVKDRVETFTADDKSYRFINRNKNDIGPLFGEFIQYNSDKYKTVIDITTEDTEYLDISAKTAGENKAFADEVFYFIVHENDLAILQTTSIRSKQLETHLNWLIKKRFGDEETGIVDDTVTLLLTDRPNEDARNKIKESKVKSTSISAPVETSDIPERRVVESTPTVETSATKSALFNVDDKSITALLLDYFIPDFNKMKLEDNLDEANLSVEIKVRYKNKTTSDGQRILEELSNTLRNSDEDFKIELENGAIISHDDIRVRGKISVEYTESGLVDETDLYTKMHQWLMQRLLSKADEAET